MHATGLSARHLLPFAFLSGSLFAAEPPTLRLPETVAPVSYRAELTLDPQSPHFSGSIAIQLTIKQSTDIIWLNQEHIAIQQAALTEGGRSFTPRIVPGGTDYVGFQFDAPLAAGAAALSIQYTGDVIEKNSSGLFRMQDAGSWYLLSQFEATDARAAFPCFDEPAYKVPWQLTLHVPAQETAISNTSIVSEKQNGKFKTVVFRPTKPLPSYLVALAVGPFEFVDGGKAGRNHIPVRIVAPKGKAAEAKYAASVTATILTRLEEYFGVPYAYDKLDNVAIPVTFGFGAMENAGMVTYSQSLILAPPETDTIRRQRQYAEVAAHELAHQWFGDLVTTAWWNDIWLNEAFATWTSSKIIAEWKPEWGTRVEDVRSKLGAANEDSLISARKVRQEIAASADINNAFDDITYEKGASVIRMFESWMGEAAFRKGVQSYMRQYSFKNATAGDFLDSLSTSSHKDVTAAFSTFLNQPGVPMISVALHCDQGKPQLHLEQERFLPLGSAGSTAQTWSIPVCVRYGVGDQSHDACTLLDKPQVDWPLEGAASCPAWVQANANAVGYYRVRYEGSLLHALTEGNVDQRLTAPERADLIGNAQAVVRSGKLPEADALALVEKFHADPVRQVVEGALDLASAPRAHLVPEELVPNFQRFVQRNFQARARELGWTPKPGESVDTTLLRPRLVRFVATWGGDAELAAQARELTAKWLRDHSAVDSNLVRAVLGTAAFSGDEALFQQLLSEFKKTQDRQIRGHLVAAMGSFRDPAANQAAMEAVLNGDVPFLEGASRLLLTTPRNDPQEGTGEAVQKLRLAFMQSHYDQVAAKMPTGGGFDFASVLPSVGRNLCDVSSRQVLKAFFDQKNLPAAKHTLDEVLEEMDLCIASKQAQEPSVEAFLKSY